MLEKFEKDVPLKNHTTFKVGGAARYFFCAKTKQDVIDSIKWAKKENVPFFVLGGGSNLLVSDKGFDGLVIKVQSSGFKIQNCDGEFNVCLLAEAGVCLSELLKFCLEQGLTGLEWASGIPGITVGGAIRGAAGAFGKRITDVLKEVEAFDTSVLETKILTAGDCGFGYKESIFKSNPDLVILSALLIFEKANKREIEKEIVRVLSYRRQHHPQLPSAGCIFKNYESRITNQELIQEFPELKVFQEQDLIPAAWLIEKAGLKGKKIGSAQISEKHPNFIVNLGGACSADILELIKLAKAKVKEKFGIELKEEIQYLGLKPN